MGKHIELIPEPTMNAFIAYPWPGNVRELQNLIERAVIESDNAVLPNPLSTLHANTKSVIASRNTLRDREAALILETLRALEESLGGRKVQLFFLGLSAQHWCTRRRGSGSSDRNNDLWVSSTKDPN